MNAIANTTVEKIEAEIVDELDMHRINWEDWSDAEQEYISAPAVDSIMTKEIIDNLSSLSSDELKRRKESNRKKIDLNLLFSDSDDIPSYIDLAWFVTFPIDFRTSRRIVQSSMKMPKESVMYLVYPFKTIDGPKRKFFDALCELGRSKGLLQVGDRLYEGALSGDPRAVKMYLELMEVLGPVRTSQQDDSGILTIDFNLS